MPTFHIEQVPGEPIFILELHEDFCISDQIQSDEVSRTILDAQEEPAFFIVDLRHMPPLTLDDLIRAANQGARSETPVWHHPKLRQLIFASELPIIRLAAQGLNSAPFGNLSVEVFETVDEALAYCHEQIRAAG
ncbi:MAG: hypothetical protein GYB68_19270 [Chloroflexi bacterium]|nr:hypothetical protein [Chloroflexota bacterium]